MIVPSLPVVYVQSRRWPCLWTREMLVISWLTKDRYFSHSTQSLPQLVERSDVKAAVAPNP